MQPLSPAKLCPHPSDPVGEWWRLARTSDGVLCVESISDRSLNRPGEPADWAYGGNVPHIIARQLTDDEDPDQVVRVLDRALLALRFHGSEWYGPHAAPAVPAIDHDAGAVKRHLAGQHIAVALSPSLADPADDPTLRAIAAETAAVDPTAIAWTYPPSKYYAGGRRPSDIDQPWPTSDTGAAAVVLAGAILARQLRTERMIATQRDQRDIDDIKLANEREHATDAITLAKLVLECAQKGIKL